MIPPYVNHTLLEEFLLNAIAEDIGEGDHSTNAIFPEDMHGKARLIAREKGIIAGLQVVDMVFRLFGGGHNIQFFMDDGDAVEKNDIVFEVESRIRTLLSAERLILNILQRMSGIATATNNLVSLIGHHPVKLLDTRKTTPNFRIFEKWAVRIGGGENHRMGLYDMIMLKDNHIDFAGGIKPAIEAAKQYLEDHRKTMKIEVETRNLREVSEVLETGGVDIIMLDNMSVGDMKKAVAMIGGRYQTEASGNITELNIADVAACGVDYISAGTITHSFKSLDLSLKTII